MLMLIFSLLGLLVAPPLYFLLRRMIHGAVVIDRLLFLIVAGLVVVHILPHSVEHVGLWAVVAAVLGWAVFYVVEALVHRSSESVHWLPIVMFGAWLAVHGLMDGAALADLGGNGQNGLPLAVVIHRVPAALLLWWLVYPRKGGVWSSFVLSVIGVGSVIGFVFASSVMSSLGHSDVVHLAESLIAGSLLHLAFHRREVDELKHSHAPTVL